MLCQLRLLNNFNHTPLHCYYRMLVCSAKIIVLLTIHLVVFHSFPPTSPSSVTTRWGATSYREWWRWLTWLHITLFTKAYMQQALRRNSLTHTTYPHVYCTHALVIYTITCYVRTWDTLVYTYSSHNCIAGNGTSAYNNIMHNTTVSIKC